MLRLAALGLLAILTLSACSDDEPTNPTPSGTYVVSTPGTYYVNDNVIINIRTGGATSDSAVASDSTVVLGTRTIGGKSAVASVVHVGGVAVDTTYLAQEGSKVLEFFPVQFSIFGGPVNLGDKWVTTFDESASKWTALSDSVPPFEIIGGVRTVNPGTDSQRIDTVKYTVSARLNFEGTKTGTENVTVDGKTLSATKSQVSLGGTVYVFLGPAPLAIDLNIPRTYWFVNGVGVVKTVQDATILNVPLLGATPVPGSRRTTVRYSIK